MLAPSFGRGCRAQRGGVGFLLGRQSRLLFAFPIGEGFVSSVLFSGRDDATGKAILIPAPISPAHVRGLHRRF